MLSRTTDTCETRATIECYVMAAIVNAREVYTDQKWLTWADHWIAGRDRSFASAKTTTPSPNPTEVHEILWLTPDEAIKHPDVLPYTDAFLAALLNALRQNTRA